MEQERKYLPDGFEAENYDAIFEQMFERIVDNPIVFMLVDPKSAFRSANGIPLSPLPRLSDMIIVEGKTLTERVIETYPFMDTPLLDGIDHGSMYESLFGYPDYDDVGFDLFGQLPNLIAMGAKVLAVEAKSGILGNSKKQIMVNYADITSYEDVTSDILTCMPAGSHGPSTVHVKST